MEIINKIWRFGRAMSIRVNEQHQRSHNKVPQAKRSMTVPPQQQQRTPQKPQQPQISKPAMQLNPQGSPIPQNTTLTLPKNSMRLKKAKQRQHTTTTASGLKKIHQRSSVDNSKMLTEPSEPSTNTNHPTLPSLAKKHKRMYRDLEQEIATDPHIQVNFLERKRSALINKLKSLTREETKLRIEERYEDMAQQGDKQMLSMVTEVPLRGLGNSAPRPRKKKTYLRGSPIPSSILQTNRSSRLSPPPSLLSAEKNHEVLEFIQRMHRDSVKRELKRVQRHNRMIQWEAERVKKAVECRRNRCKGEAASMLDQTMI